MKYAVIFLVGLLVLFGTSGESVAQSILGKTRADLVPVLDALGPIGDGVVRSGSCLKPIGEVGTEEFTVYLLLSSRMIEGFVVEMSGDDGDQGEVVANGGIVSFNEAGDAVIRGNNGLDWVAEAYRLAVNFIRGQEMFEDASYAEALSRRPMEKCPRPPPVRP
jgi:hypothetical protein